MKVINSGPVIDKIFAKTEDQMLLSKKNKASMNDVNSNRKFEYVQGRREKIQARGSEVTGPIHKMKICKVFYMHRTNYSTNKMF